MPTGLRIELQAGQVFGSLVTVERVASHFDSNGTGSRLRRWLCRCTCGATAKLCASDLALGKRTSCKTCAYKKRPQSVKRLSDVAYLYNLSIKTAQRKRGIEIGLSMDEFAQIITMPCHYCGAEPEIKKYRNANKIAPRMSLRANGVDRVDSGVGYVRANCVPCCKRCNIAKNTMSSHEFLDHISRIYRHCFGGKERQV